MILATTTSTQDSGLLDVLVPAFEKESGAKVKTVAVGSGQAIEMGARGEADVVLVHSPAAEEEMVADGKGRNRRIVMHNDFVIVGPASDPGAHPRCERDGGDGAHRPREGAVHLPRRRLGHEHASSSSSGTRRA